MDVCCMASLRRKPKKTLSPRFGSTGTKDLGTETEKSPAHTFRLEIESIHHLNVSILGKYFRIFFNF